VVRDLLMSRLAPRYPVYAWDTNKGYGTAEHLAALDAAGFTVHHRKSFSPVVQLELAIGRSEEEVGVLETGEVPLRIE
jgi:ribonuclease HII